jgi:hypothetical protein
MVFKKKRRSDKKYKYRRKHGKLIPYYPKRNKNDDIKIWFFEERPMSADSIRRIPAKLRSTARKIAFVPSIRVDVPPSRLSNEKNIEDLSIEVMGRPGSFYIKSWGHAKNPYHCSPRTLCTVKIFETEEGLKARFGKAVRIWRYWFWEKRRRKK